MPKSAAVLAKRLNLTIAGLGIELTWQDTRFADEPALKFYRDFFSSGDDQPIEVRLHLHCGEVPNVRSGAIIFEALCNNWQLSRLNGRYLFEFFDTRPPHPKSALALMAPDFQSGEIHCRSEIDHPDRCWSLVRLMRPLGELLMVSLLSQGRGVLIHGLGVSDRGEGLLFIGRSGAGKTTLSNLYKPDPGVTILGDERVIVTKAQGQFWLSGTPWPGTGFTVSADTVPLRRIFFLEHGARNELIPDQLIKLCGLFPAARDLSLLGFGLF